MNQTNNNNSQHTGVDSTYSPTQSNPQTNPFTEGLKGEFTSNFGTNTNAVSQIFKDGNFVNQNKTKYILAAVGVLLLAVVAVFILTEPGANDDPFAGTEDNPIGLPDGTDPLATTEADPTATPDAAADGTVGADGQVMDGTMGADGQPMDGTMADGQVVDDGQAQMAGGETTEYSGQATPEYGGSGFTKTSVMASGPITLMEPADGQKWIYDETETPARFTWDGGSSGMIVFSRSPTMSPEVMRVPATGYGYTFHNPYPGTWYWQMVNNSGTTDVRSFVIDPPVRRNIVVNQIAEISGNGGVVEWQGDEKVAFYRVEFSTGGWANPQYRFATTGTKVQVQGLAAGAYKMRVGAFSEVSGRWEYTAPSDVTVN